ncbi:MAG TPA: hypothetical protein VI488_01860 [Candidatus Angelobacter sp.]
MSSRPDFRILASAFLAMIALSGCSIYSSRDHRTGQDKDVDIRTPLGSISVHTGESDPKATGLSLYPGAQVKKDIADRDSSANVNISSSFFGVKVVALKYQSNDSPDKVLGFYRKEMARYGKVVDCTGGFTLGFHHHDDDSEVTCDDRNGSGHEYSEELKVGTQKNQRIVAIRPNGSGSEFALVYVRASDARNTM